MERGVGIVGFDIECSGAHPHSAALRLILKQYWQQVVFALVDNAKLHNVWSTCPQVVF